MAGGDLLQVANERQQANGVGVGDQRRSIDQGRFEKDLPAAVVAQWRARWPGVEHALRLLPGTRTANSFYVHVECVPCVFHHNKRLVTEATPMRSGLRTQEQHEAVALLACDIARRNGWPLQVTWWRTPKLLGHEDLTPYNRYDKVGGWDPGGMRAMPYFDWDFVFTMIERECRAKAAAARPSWWPFSEVEDELEQEDGQAAELSESEWEEGEQDDRQEYDTESEPEGPYDEAAYEEANDEAHDEGGPVDETENELDNEREAEDEAKAVFLEPLRVAMAVARGERHEDKLTNDVFFARYSRAGSPGDQPRREGSVRDLDRHPRPAGASAAGPRGQADDERRRCSGGRAHWAVRHPHFERTRPDARPEVLHLSLHPEDALWTAKLIHLEAGSGKPGDMAAVIWAMFNKVRPASAGQVVHRVHPEVLHHPAAGPRQLHCSQRHYKKSGYVRTGGTYKDKRGRETGIPEEQLKRQLDYQAAAWADLDPKDCALTLDALRGTLANPGIGAATEFAWTRILWQQNKNMTDEPSDRDWLAYTQGYPARRGEAWTWVGNVDGINQPRNAFFQRNADASLPAGAVSVVP